MTLVYFYIRLNSETSMYSGIEYSTISEFVGFILWFLLWKKISLSCSVLQDHLKGVIKSIQSDKKSVWILLITPL